MKKITFILAFLVAGFAYSQDRTCGMTAYMEEKMQDPEFAKEYLKTQERFKAEFQKTLTSEQRTRPFVQIPVAVHFPGGSEANRACLEALAQNQIDILNDDFTGTNADISDWGAASGNYPGVFTGVTNLEFCLATSNHPAGTDTDLVEGGPAVTIGYNFGGGGDSDTNWSGYMNFLVKDIGGGILGYSPLGGNAAAGQSVVLNTFAFGSGAGCPGYVPGFPYNLGRTTTHELGHFYNLLHPFTGSCGSDDAVADTPNISDPNYGCLAAGSVNACVAGEKALTMSFMDYTDDRCMYMFSSGQTARMDTYLNVLGPQFHTDRCEAVMIFDLDARLSVVDLNVVDCATSTMAPDVRITNAGNNTLTSATISYYLDGDTPVDYDWTGSLAYNESEVIAIPEIITTSGPHTFYADLSVPNGGTDMNTANDNASDSHTYAAGGCPSIGNETDGYFTSTTGVIFNTISNLGNNPGGDSGYSDFTGISTDVERTVAYDITVNVNTDGNWLCKTLVWFDWNQNCSFDDAGEEYDLGEAQGVNGGPTSLSGLSISIPAGAALGNTLMRVTTKYFDPPTSCENNHDAEVEDYTINVMPALSIDEFGLNSISLYPNPTSGVLNISLSNNDLPDGYSIYNMLGQTLSQKVISNVSDLSVNTANLSDGMYFIKITKEGNTISLPFIKK